MRKLNEIDPITLTDLVRKQISDATPLGHFADFGVALDHRPGLQRARGREGGREGGVLSLISHATTPTRNPVSGGNEVQCSGP